MGVAIRELFLGLPTSQLALPSSLGIAQGAAENVVLVLLPRPAHPNRRGQLTPIGEANSPQSERSAHPKPRGQLTSTGETNSPQPERSAHPKPSGQLTPTGETNSPQARAPLTGTVPLADLSPRAR